MKSLSMLVLWIVSAQAGWAVCDFAYEVVEFQGSFSATSDTNDPNAVLGPPAAVCQNKVFGIFDMPPTFRVKIVEAAYNRLLDGRPALTTIREGEYVTVKFDHRVVDYPLNPYGQDFIVFGNAFYQHASTEEISDASNMNAIMLPSSTQVESDDVIVKVSHDGQNWFSFGDPWTYKTFPAQAYSWDRQSGCWTDELMDVTRPVDPNLVFSSSSAADVIEAYDGSAGGTPFDLRDLAEYDQLPVDPNSGCRWIQYVRLEGVAITGSEGQVDAIADVAACGDPTHPFPAGDITRDCRVDLRDLALLSGSWLECTYKCE